MAMLQFYTLADLANSDAADWYGGSYASYLYPDSGLDSRRLSEFLEALGREENDRKFFPAVLNRLHHFDIYGFANNHAMQHGEEAYIQTWDSLQAQGCKMFGKKDSRSIYFWHQGKCVALTGCCFRIDEFTTNPSYWYNPEYK